MADTPGAEQNAPEQNSASPETAPAPAAPASAAPAAEQPAVTDAATPAPAAPAAPAAAPAPMPDTRPRPEYGEYAPEGWEWKPEPDATAVNAGQAAASHQSAAGSGGGSGRAGSSNTMQGVPHNLGSSIPRPARRAAAKRSNTQTAAGEPYRSASAGQPAAPSQPQGQPQGQQPQFQNQQFQAPAGGVGGYQKPANMGDRVITILLLVFGGFGALQSAFALMGMTTMFRVLEDAPGVTELTPPAWMDLTGKIAGMALLVLYGLVLVYSIRRLRARKLTFWAPLAAGMFATVVVLTIVGAAMVQTPELMEIIADPQASTELIEYLQGFPSN